MLNRRDILAALSAGALSSFSRTPLAEAAEAEGKPPLIRGEAPLSFAEPRPFSFERLVATAREKVRGPYVPAPNPAPEVTRRIGYSQHNAIFQAVADGLYADRGPEGIVTTFHLGELFRRPVTLNALEDGIARQLLYREGYFSYPEDSPAADMPASMSKSGAGFAGFRVHEPWNGDRYAQPGDWLVFLGAAYFRSSGDLKQYGLSSRGLAVDTARPGGGPEEFPDFTEFWITPMIGGRMTIYALMEGKSVAGAYRFEVTHYPHVTMDVTCRLFLRRDVARFGVSPLTSMYWYSQERRWAAGDWRPEVHDSDGLLIRRKDGSALWRPLTDPDEVRVTAFDADGMSGFGLMQRDRAYDHYQDRAAFQRRPNLYVEPVEGFAGGQIQLVELPTRAEFNDNIVAFYVPDAPAKAGDEMGFRYRLHWSGAEPETPLARLVDVRLNRPRLRRAKGEPERLERKLVLDFAGPAMAGVSPEEVTPVIEASCGRAFRPKVERAVDRADGMRLEFDLFTEETEPCEIRVRLTAGDKVLSETAAVAVKPDQDLVGKG